jgi:cell division inhibitor SepF
MSALYRLKAYFGMVPAEDMDAYLDYDRDYGAETGYYDDHRRGYPEPPEPRSERGAEHRLDSRTDHVAERAHAERRYPAPREPERESLPADPPAPRVGSTGASRPAEPARTPVTRGSLAVEPLTAEPPSPPAPLLDVPRSAAPAGRSAAKELPLSRITTVHPRSYNEARTIGERYRDGIPVIMNLTELDDAAAKRLVDFAAGLAFALRGSIDKVTSRVFLLSPMGVEVSAEERRKLAERGFFSQD